MKTLMFILLLFTLTCPAQVQYKIVGQVTMSDQDSGQVHTYKMMSGGGGYFHITTGGQIYVSPVIYNTFAIPKTWNLQIACWDDGVLYNMHDSTLTLHTSMVSTKIIPVTLQPHPPKIKKKAYKSVKKPVPLKHLPLKPALKNHAPT